MSAAQRVTKATFIMRTAPSTKEKLNLTLAILTSAFHSGCLVLGPS